MRLDAAGIQLLPGVVGGAYDAVAAYLAGTLDSNPDEVCDHYDHGHGHDCGDGCCH